MTESNFIDAIADEVFKARNGDENDVNDAVVKASREWLTSDYAAERLTQRLVDNLALTYPVSPDIPLNVTSPIWKDTLKAAREALQNIADAIERGAS